MTDMFLVALQIGLSSSELRTIPYSNLVWLIHRYVEMRKTDTAGEVKHEQVREANEADWNALKLM